MKPFSKINWRYALGEILIVIIGISIAFALNNWGENRKSNSEKEKYLLSLIQDLESDSLQLTENIELLKTRVDHVDQIRKYIGRHNPRKDTLLPKFYQLPLPIDFRPRNITYKTLINSGDFKLIDDFKLKTAIEEHYQEYEYILEVYERQNILVDKYLGNFFMNELDYTAIYNGDFSFMESTFFANMIGAQKSTFGLKISASENGKSRCLELIDVLKEAL